MKKIKTLFLLSAGFALGFGFPFKNNEIKQLEEENAAIYNLYQSLGDAVDYDYHLELEEDSATIINSFGEHIGTVPFDSVKKTITFTMPLSN